MKRGAPAAHCRTFRAVASRLESAAACASLSPMNVPTVSTEPRRLNVGCGLDIRPGWVNLDVVDYGGNAITDLNKYPWSFPDSHFDEVYASHILEHLPNFNAVVTEIWRISKPGALFTVKVPFFLSTKYFSEPDHRTPFGIRSFDNYEDVTGRELKFYEQWKLGHRTNYNSPARFRVESKRFHMSNFAALRWLNAVINLEPVIYERFFATWLTPEEVWFELRVTKEGSR
jgi:predicted SAM-dependent methyltransferase